MSPKRSDNLLRTLFSFSQRERKRVLLLLPLLVLLCLLFAWQGKPRFEQSFTRYADLAADSLQQERKTRYDRHSEQRGNVSNETSSPDSRHPAAAAAAGEGTSTRPEPQHSLFAFDPNTVSKAGLVALGFSPKQAQAILNYREAGARFRKPEDFARCYTVSPEKFRELAPYIRIAEDPQVRQQQATPAPAVPQDTTSIRPSGAQPVQPVPPRQSRTRERLELNSADSAALVTIHGIGALTAGRIVRYREALGGYAATAQLQEIAGMTDRNYQLILQQIRVDSSKIQKIDINFASPKRMQGHPYLPLRVLDRILKYRQLKGGWSSTGDLIEQHILSAEQAERLAPYLLFRAE